MNQLQYNSADVTRRQFFARNAVGLGIPALASLLPGELAAGEGRTQLGGLAGLPHFPPKVKNVIYLLQNGAPPHVDMYDYKPQMEKWRGKELPESVHKNQRLSTMTAGKTKAVLPAFTPLAFTNPIYVDADGDGKWNPPGL